MMLAYHELSKAGGRDVYALSPEKFRRHVDIVSRHGRASYYLSFDDGHASNFELARPILQEHEVPALFFITTAWVGVLGSVMSWSQVRQLFSEGHIIGSHTHTHPLLTSCGEKALRNELTASKRLIEDHLGGEVNTISLPGGRANPGILMACREAGYTRVYTSRVGEFMPMTETTPEVIGRYIVTRATSDLTLTAYLAGEARTRRRLRCEALAKSSLKALMGDGLYQKVWRKVARSQSFGT
jgi:peptidoglycan/xylan/chitin deacetylase (PgdA/CDA1 family)